MSFFSEHLTTEKVVMGLAYRRLQPDLMPRPHSHNEIELNLMEQGALTYLIGSTRVGIRTGQFALFWGAVPHQVIAREPDAILHWLTLPLATVLQWQLPAVLTQPLMRGKCIQMPVDLSGYSQTALLLFQQWHESLREQVAEQNTIVLLEVEAYLRRLALALARAGNDVGGTKETQGKPAHEVSTGEQLASFIAQHYTQAIPVEEIAQQVHLHPNYAMTLFREQFGVSMVEYITHYRLAHAQRLLITTQLNASQIALEAGFGSVSRFYVVFKQAFGLSPGQYRASLHLPIPQPDQENRGRSREPRL